MTDNLLTMASVYDQTGAFNKLWNDIMHVHWKFLDADESMEKIQLRSKLEDLILEYLCIFPHSRKFFHVETVHVLKSSIAKLEDFSAYKASLGFEAISQYANNLFTKPWRKEYKTVKMYSGFYRHEIAANLVGAEVLFEQMGYRVLPNQTLVFEGAICPDRVTNVSRDAITANVECQIMKEIYNQLTEMSLPVDWSDIFCFRENNTMNIESSVQQMAALIKEKHQKNQQARREASSASHYGGPMGVAPPTGTYDAVDSCNMAYSNHPYNVSGNRFPIPYNISANIGPCINGMAGKSGLNESYYHHPSIMNYPQIPQYYHHRSSSNGQLYGQQPQSHRHTPDIYINHNFDNTGTQTPPSILSKRKTSYGDYDVPSVRHGSENKHKEELMYMDTREEAKKERKKSDRGVKTADLLGDYECDMLPDALVERHQQHQQHHHQVQSQHRHHHLHHQVSRNSRQSDFDSYEDEQLQAEAYQRASNVNRRISSKNQDGIGSYETWNYVFQNLEKQGYNKDLGERGDFLVNAEEDEFPEGNTSRGSTLKRSSNDKLKAMKAKSADKVDGIRVASTRQSLLSATRHDRENERNEMVARAGQKPSLVQKLSKPISNNQADNNHKANHTNNGNSTNNNEASGSRRNSITRKYLTSTKETVTSTTNATNSSSTSTGGGILISHNSSNYHDMPAVSNRKKTASFDTAAATIINPQDNRDRIRNSSNGGTKVSEWNCKFCTYLNPDSERICEMCAKSRDFNSSGAKATTAATSNGTATCV
ncbi:protein tamozhennic-like isoform X2 [Topomyia yanbarensis]|uniref:protein tamozhennic-like isoform X2 n=1 Tax=Topomyia yanbarensis TaxID=2498891 RepID=UPI00273BD646|nr:protein tamozhennic-like isoform X2 [Topomyia yanbarensis]